MFEAENLAHGGKLYSEGEFYKEEKSNGLIENLRSSNNQLQPFFTPNSRIKAHNKIHPSAALNHSLSNSDGNHSFL
jgi:hypothetical protein